LVLDHSNGNRYDNRTKNLRLLCPNCNAQLSTHGGRNIGKVENSEGGFLLRDEFGRRHYHLVAEAGVFQTVGGGVSTRGIEGKADPTGAT
jgi:hypothetical protein